MCLSAGLNNLYIQLLKASNHPLLFLSQSGGGRQSNPLSALEEEEAEEESARSPGEDTFESLYERHLVASSNKLLVLRRLLRVVLPRGERVVVFSHSTQLLDLVEDFLTEEGILSARLDGRSSESERREALETFLAPTTATIEGESQTSNGELESPREASGGAIQEDSTGHPLPPRPVMLISVRAGGFGLSLTPPRDALGRALFKCRVCVFLDGGGIGNPQLERQAVARLHRQGQTLPVVALRLISTDTGESLSVSV